MKTWTTLAMAIGLGALAGAQTFLYQPTRVIADQGIRISPWGSGLISETDEVAYQGAQSLRVSTRNLFQGGRITFGQPVDLATLYGDKNSLLLFVLRLPDEGAAPGGGAVGPGGPSGPGLGTPGGLRPGGGPGAPGGLRPGGGGGRPGGPGAMGAGAGDDVTAGGPAGGVAGSTPLAPLTRVRAVITTTDGLRSETFLQVTTTAAGERGWRQVAIPLQAISGFGRTNKTIREIALSGNSTATFWLGEMRVINDTTRITGEPSFREVNAGLATEVTFSARGFGGASILKYTWDFDVSDGIQAEAEGQVVRRRFRQPGEFTVTLTISDAFGLKEPYSTTIKVTVNP